MIYGRDLPKLEPRPLRCGLCELPLGLRGSSPAMKALRPGSVAYAHQDCVVEAATQDLHAVGVWDKRVTYRGGNRGRA